MVIDEAGLLFETHQTLQDSSDLTEIVKNQFPLLEQEIVISWFSMGQTVQEFDIDVEIGPNCTYYWWCFWTILVRLQGDNNKVKMIISMFGNDTVAEVNLNQIAEL